MEKRSKRFARPDKSDLAAVAGFVLSAAVILAILAK
jgi:hypothetical protein